MADVLTHPYYVSQTKMRFQVECKVFVVLHQVQKWIRVSIEEIIKCIKAESKLIRFNIQLILTTSAKTIAMQSILLSCIAHEQRKNNQREYNTRATEGTKRMDMDTTATPSERG